MPISLPQSWLSTNESTPAWLFVPIALASVIVTAFILLILRWNRPEQLQADSKIARFVKRLFGRRPRKSAVEDEKAAANEGDSMVSRKDTKTEDAMVRVV